MNIFIDTNVFLNFYHYSNDDLEELKKLAVLIDQRKVILHLPQQIIDEFNRNRSSKIADAIKRLRNQKLNLQFPQLTKDYPEYKKLRDAQKEYSKSHKELIKKIESDVDQHSLKADTIIQDLFNSSPVISHDETITEKARLRFNLGNPPGKDNSLGDAVVWETLLEEVPNNEVLHFISDDYDYFDALDANKFDEFLSDEWKKNKNSNIKAYRQLSQFFQEHFPSIRLASELDKEILITKLSASDNFEKTHKYVGKLSTYSDFTKSQVNEIFHAVVNNNQIYWIIDDPDIDQFITKLLKEYKNIIDTDLLEQLSEFRPENKQETLSLF